MEQGLESGLFQSLPFCWCSGVFSLPSDAAGDGGTTISSSQGNSSPVKFVLITVSFP